MNRIKANVTLNAGIVAALSLILGGYFLISSSGVGDVFGQRRGTITIDRAVAVPLTTAEGNQVKVGVNYDIEDQSLVGQRINAIMGIYDRQNGTLIKLSSFPNGFILNNTNGTTQLATTLTDPRIQNISAIITFTNADKSEKYTNDVKTDLDLRSILPTSLEDLPSPVLGSQIGTLETQETGTPTTSNNENGADGSSEGDADSGGGGDEPTNTNNSPGDKGEEEE